MMQKRWKTFGIPKRSETFELILIDKSVVLQESGQLAGVCGERDGERAGAGRGQAGVSFSYRFIVSFRLVSMSAKY